MDKRRRILVIDDEEGIRYTFESFLSEAGYEVATAADFGAAVARLDAGDYDLVLADIVLGGKSGIDVIREVRRRIDAGERPDFPAETDGVRRDTWSVGAIPMDLRDRRVEITGPTDRKMVINALNSGANAFMADFEDANAPTWENMVSGQINLRDAVSRTIAFDNGAGRTYRLNDAPATLMVRPRGWHLHEKHVRIDGEPMIAALFDFGLYLMHNGRALLERGSGPYFYLPKLENRHEARLWNDVFDMAEDAMGIPRGSIKATVLIEHVLAVFEAEEILYELRAHCTGLNCGRWDYIFSFIKTFGHDPACVLPDREQIGRASCRERV